MMCIIAGRRSDGPAAWAPARLMQRGASLLGTRPRHALGQGAQYYPDGEQVPPGRRHTDPVSG